MVKEMSVEELLKWKEKGFGHVQFVIVKTKTCPKCIKFLNHFDKYFDRLEDENVAIFTQENTLEYDESRKLLLDLLVTTVPVVLYKDNSIVRVKYTDDLNAFDTWMKSYLTDNGNAIL